MKDMDKQLWGIYLIGGDKRLRIIYFYVGIKV